jgi:hypothetical protein
MCRTIQLKISSNDYFFSDKLIDSITYSAELIRFLDLYHNRNVHNEFIRVYSKFVYIARQSSSDAWLHAKNICAVEKNCQVP